MRRREREGRRKQILGEKNREKEMGGGWGTWVVGGGEKKGKKKKMERGLVGKKGRGKKEEEKIEREKLN